MRRMFVRALMVATVFSGMLMALVVSMTEVPAGPIDGVNSAFALKFIPKSGTLKVTKNGVDVPPDAYKWASKLIMFETPPAKGDTLQASYRYEDSYQKGN